MIWFIPMAEDATTCNHVHDHIESLARKFQHIVPSVKTFSEDTLQRNDNVPSELSMV